ncbi:MAG: hypothetical protein GXO36_00645 [Chloroflexi bacterium]|nr:hypothetical protein [Chloroflexota bacterium]
MSRRTRDILIGALLLSLGLGLLGVPVFQSISQAGRALLSLLWALWALVVTGLGLHFAYRAWRRRWGRGRYGLVYGLGLAGLGLAILANQLTDRQVSLIGGLLAGLGLGYLLRVLRR